MLKRISLIMAACLTSLMLAMPARAFEVLDTACQRAPTSPACQQNTARKGDKTIVVVDVIQKGANVIAVLAGLIAVGIVIYSGYKYVLSRGNAEEQKKARTSLEGAVIGLIIIALAYLIVSVVINLLS